jgi:hypothetical protein
VLHEVGAVLPRREFGSYLGVGHVGGEVLTHRQLMGSFNGTYAPNRLRSPVRLQGLFEFDDLTV